MYTGLIFLVAIILIIIAFFGQANVMKSQPPVETPVVSAAPQEGIAQKASVLSEQNAALIKQTEDLKAQLSAKDADFAAAQTRIAELEVNAAMAQNLCSVYEFVMNGRMDDAKETFVLINPDALTAAQRANYESLKAELD